MRAVAQGLPERLEALYAKYNSKEFIEPDPLQCLYQYEDPADREVAGIIASSLAFGAVRQIVSSVSSVLEEMPQPASWLRRATRKTMARTFDGFVHRFVRADGLCDFLWGIARARDRHGSIRACFVQGLNDADPTVFPALGPFVAELLAESRMDRNYLLPCPANGSPCKRLNLYLRWMIRRDDVDPGVWAPLPACKLIVPLDVHMHRVALRLGLTNRAGRDMRTALQITDAFRRIVPEDPVRYDFALTRASMRKNWNI